MGRILNFDYLEEDNLCTRVCVDYENQTVDVENFTDDVVCQAFGNRVVGIEDIDVFFRERVFPETRVDANILLSILGLKNFDAEAIARKTHGKMFHDLFWIRFDGENISYSDIIKE